VDHAARRLDIELNDPRERCDVGVPGPLRPVAVAVEARPHRQLARARRVPRWLLDDRRIRMGAAIGDELDDREDPDQPRESHEEDLEQTPHRSLHTVFDATRTISGWCQVDAGCDLTDRRLLTPRRGAAYAHRVALSLAVT